MRSAKTAMRSIMVSSIKPQYNDLPGCKRSEKPALNSLSRAQQLVFQHFEIVGTAASLMLFSIPAKLHMYHHPYSYCNPRIDPP